MCNRGWFKKGFDPRRHILTPEDRARGGYRRWISSLLEGGSTTAALVYQSPTLPAEPERKLRLVPRPKNSVGRTNDVVRRKS